jgi:hypothetical protein
MLSTLVTAALAFSPAVLEARAQATLYRWFAFYETETPDFDAQYAILADDVRIDGPISVTSLDEYKAALEEPYFVFGQNAHHVESVTFHSLTPEATALAVTITYQGVGRDGVTQAARLAYEITMVEDGGALPKIKSLSIAPLAAAEPVFVSTYATNRARAEAFAAQATAAAR